MTTSTAAPSAAVPLVRVRGLCKHFHGKSGNAWGSQPQVVKVLNDINFDIQAGETFGIAAERRQVISDLKHSSGDSRQ